jgi:methyltransferase-like protein/ubiquinone/menaquinone biosynthesis C-methylase UbiE
MNNYDDIPYPSLVYTDTHPNRLATLATLFGLKPPPIATSRILELGCGDGTNLIAIAQTLPAAQCWGIDAAVTQIAQGKQLIQAIPLTNITLNALDFNDIDETWGTFDYIIAHGIYSWISLPMQEVLLSLIRHHLAPNGIAYVSYNIYPGWHLENVVRDLMIYHTQQLPEAPFKLGMMQAKGILQFITRLRQPADNAFEQLLKEKNEQLQTVDDNYLYHDFLAGENHPVYFYQFIQHIAKHQLAYLTDIEFKRYLMLNFPPEVVEALEELFQGDEVRQEQYLDFFYNRTLRRSLLCHPENVTTRKLQWAHVNQLLVTSTLQFSTATDDANHPMKFQTPNGEMATVTESWLKKMLIFLIEQVPKPVAVAELFQSTSSIPSEETFVQALASLYCQDILEFYLYPPSYETQWTNKPLASPLARYQASQGRSPVINLRCEFINLTPVATALLPHLNGEKTLTHVTPSFI